MEEVLCAMALKSANGRQKHQTLDMAMAMADKALPDMRPPPRPPSTGSPPSRCLYQPPAAMGGRAEHPWLYGGHLERPNGQEGLAMMALRR
jgi:hypothetical protein